MDHPEKISDKETLERNHKKEEASKLGKLAHKMAEVKEARMSASTSELMQVAQVMVFCGLPYRRTDEREVERSARTASGDSIRVTFRAMVQGVDLPFGTDRSLLHWITHQAVMTRSPFIPLSSASAYLRDMGMTASGPNIKRTREAFQRIASFALVVSRDNGINIERLIMPLIQASLLPRSLDGEERPKQELRRQLSLLSNAPNTQKSPEQGITLNDAVFREFMQHHVPTLRKLLEVTRESPQTQDYMLFLQWRSFAAKKVSLITWDQLREQFPSEDTNPRRFRVRFQEAIKALKIAWPQLNASAKTQGLEIGPPTQEQYLLLEGLTHRRISD